MKTVALVASLLCALSFARAWPITQSGNGTPPLRKAGFYSAVSMSGRVCDAKTGAPLAGAFVAAEVLSSPRSSLLRARFASVTDREGRYGVYNLPHSRIQVHVDGPDGYRPTEFTTLLTGASEAMVSDISLFPTGMALPAACTLAEHVVELNVGEQHRVACSLTPPLHPVTLYTTLDRDDIGIVDGQGVFSALHPGVVKLTVHAGVVTDTVTITVQPQTMITPTVAAQPATADEPDALVVTWPSMGNRVIAYLIYRDTNLYAPVAVVDGQTLQYLDSTRPLPTAGAGLESTKVTVRRYEDGGVVTLRGDPVYAQANEDMRDPAMVIERDAFSITCRRSPLHADQRCGYRIRALYLDQIDAGPGEAQRYQLQLSGFSLTSQRISVDPPKPPVKRDRRIRRR